MESCCSTFTKLNFVNVMRTETKLELLPVKPSSSDLTGYSEMVLLKCLFVVKCPSACDRKLYFSYVLTVCFID